MLHPSLSHFLQRCLDARSASPHGLDIADVSLSRIPRAVCRGIYDAAIVALLIPSHVSACSTPFHPCSDFGVPVARSQRMLKYAGPPPALPPRFPGSVI